MSLDPWPAEPGDDVLGAVVHGPALVARSTNVAVAVRSVVARPEGLEIDVVLRATGVRAEAAGRQTFGDHAGSELRLAVELDGRIAAARPLGQTSSGGTDRFGSEQRVAVAGLPVDGTVTLTASWPEAGLSEGSVTLALGPLDDLEARVVRLSG